MATLDLIERPTRDQLGEAPFWDEAAGVLYWVDIVGRRVSRFDPETGEIAEWTVPKHCSGAIPTLKGDLIVAMRDGLHRLDLESSETEPFARPDPDPGNRSNECRTDPQGRLWLGTMCNNLAPDGAPIPLTRSSGGVYCVDADGASTKLLGDIGITNNFTWSPDGTRFYTNDTKVGVIWSFAYQPDGPELRDQQVFVEGGPGKPDGAAMDEEGCLWEARWGGGRVIRYTPGGRVDREIELPVAQPSSCAFGGPDRKTLFITSARQELDNLPPDSLDGSVFVVRLDVAGLPMRPFIG